MLKGSLQTLLLLHQLENREVLWVEQQDNMNPCGAEQIEEERAFWYSYPYLPAAMCWAMKSMSAATLEKTPGEPRAVVLLLLASHPLAQPTPQDTTPASIQVPPVLRHARGPPESPWWGGKEPCSPVPAAAN